MTIVLYIDDLAIEVSLLDESKSTNCDEDGVEK